MQIRKPISRAGGAGVSLSVSAIRCCRRRRCARTALSESNHHGEHGEQHGEPHEAVRALSHSLGAFIKSEHAAAPANSSSVPRVLHFSPRAGSAAAAAKPQQPYADAWLGAQAQAHRQRHRFRTRRHVYARTQGAEVSLGQQPSSSGFCWRADAHHPRVPQAWLQQSVSPFSCLALGWLTES